MSGWLNQADHLYDPAPLVQQLFYSVPAALARRSSDAVLMYRERMMTRHPCVVRLFAMMTAWKISDTFPCSISGRELYAVTKAQFVRSR
jgi:hypothetical protein